MQNISILFQKANYLHSNYIGNEGELDYPDKQYGYLCDEIEDVEIGFYKDDSVDSDYAERLRKESFSLTEIEACNILYHRVTEIEDYYNEIGNPLIYNVDFENDSELLEEFEEGEQNRFRNNDFRSFEQWKEDKLND